MTLLQVEGFGQYGTDETKMLDGNWAELTGNIALTQVADKVRTGSTALLFPDSAFARHARRVFPIVLTTAWVNFAHRYTDRLPQVADVGELLTFRDSDNLIQVTLWIMTTGQIRVAAGAHSNISVSPVIFVGAYQSIQMKVVINATTGSYEVRVDNVVVTFTGATINIDTDPTTFGSTGQYQFGTSSNTGGDSAPEETIDDLFTLDAAGSVNNDFIGDRQAFLILPDADTATADWGVTGAASGFQAINEIPDDGDTSYIEATVVNDQSIFGLEDIATTVTNIAGVQMTQVARKLDAGGAQLQGALISNAAVATGADRPITENYNHWNDVIELDPDGNIAWTAAKFNATEYRIEKTA